MIPNPLPRLRNYLLVDAATAALVGTRVYVARLPREDSAAMPRACVILNAAGGPGDAGLAPIGDTRIDARCYGATDMEAMTLYYAVREAFKHMPRAIYTGLLLHAVTIETGPLALQEPEVDWPLVLGTFRVTAAELAAV